MRLSDIHENAVLSRWSRWLPRRPDQVGAVHETDAELIPLGDGRLLALTVDTVSEEVSAGLFTDPFTAGRTAVISSVSDLAAVGAQPVGLLLAVTLPGDDPAIQEAVARGVAEACTEAGTWVLGGDTGDGPFLQVTVAAAGLVPEGQQLTRVGLAPGHRLLATGLFGDGAAVAASALLPGDTGYAETDYRPQARLLEGMALRGLASAAMDTSDGLLATLDQLARLNGVGIDVQAEPLALLEPGAAALADRLGLPPLALLGAHHGEFELVFGVPEAQLAAVRQLWAARGWQAVELGAVTAEPGVRLGGRTVDVVAFRNLLHDTGGDLQAYVARLLALAGEAS